MALVGEKMQDENKIHWTTEQIILQRWLATPKRERKLKTMANLASDLGLDEATLYRWKKIDGFSDTVRQLIRDNLKDDLAEIYASLRREAKAGSFQHIKLALELAGDYAELSTVNVNVNSSELLRSRIDSVASRLRAGSNAEGTGADSGG